MSAVPRASLLRAIAAFVITFSLAVFGFSINVPYAVAQDEKLTLKLIKTTPDEAGGDWYYVGDGQIKLKEQRGLFEADFGWDSPRPEMDMTGFPLSLHVKAQGKASRIYAGIQASGSSFEFDPSPAEKYADANPGQTVSESIIVSVRPSPGLQEGMEVDLTIGATFGKHVTYTYKVMGQGGGVDQSRLTATIDDCPADIVISAYPPLNCHITISGYRKNTADEVEVSFPDELDTFGNHANGIQLSGRGSMTVFAMHEEDPYSWGLFIFACASQEHTGANCYDNVTVPGTVTVNILVRQKNTGEVLVPLTFNAIPRGGGGGAGQVARIGSRFDAGSFINIQSGSLVSSPILVAWLSAQWEFQKVENTEFVRLKNVWKPEIFLHMENGKLEAGPIQPQWESAMWKIEPVEGTPYIRICNRWRSGECINSESGTLQSSAIDTEFDSSLWWLLQ